jgi:ATP-binding cassette subfamily C protein LapB
MQVGERGRALSGGQRQAVALARIFMRDPGVLFLDESSSSMDTATEAALCEALSDWAGKDKTLIIATHRGSMLGLVERVIVIDSGKVMADGPKADVMRYLQQRGAENRAKTSPGDG